MSILNYSYLTLSRRLQTLLYMSIATKLYTTRERMYIALRITFSVDVGIDSRNAKSSQGRARTTLDA